MLAAFRIVVGAVRRTLGRLAPHDCRRHTHLYASTHAGEEEIIVVADWSEPRPPRTVSDPTPGTDPDHDSLARLDEVGLDDPGDVPQAVSSEEPPSEEPPADGPPWTDASLLGPEPGGEPVAGSEPVAGGDRTKDEGGDAALNHLLAYAGEEASTDDNPWATLLTSDDPATSTLARWWLPPA